MVQFLRKPHVPLLSLALLAVVGCETARNTEVARKDVPEQVPRTVVATDDGKPIYALGTLPVSRTANEPAAKNVSYTRTSKVKPAKAKPVRAKPVQLRKGRFSYPDYREPELARAVEHALDKEFKGQVHFKARSQFSYEYASTLRMTGRFKKQVTGVVVKVATERTMAKLGPDDTWRPDYGRIARETPVKLPNELKKMVRKSGANPRDWLGPLVSHIQAIPYGLPPNGFLFPDEVLAFDYGDCDSKAVLAAAIIERADPELDYIFVDLPSTDHLVLGLTLKPKRGEQSIRVKGQTYVLIEISGPAVLPIGALSNRSATALRSSSTTAILASGHSLGL